MRDSQASRSMTSKKFQHTVLGTALTYTLQLVIKNTIRNKHTHTHTENIHKFKEDEGRRGLGINPHQTEGENQELKNYSRRPSPSSRLVE